MIKDPQALADIQRDWIAVRKLCNQGGLFWGRHGEAISFNPPEDTYNLPFFLAFAVLDQCLNILIKENHFKCSDWKLGAKMNASRAALTWKNYSAVDAGRKARNDLAHEAVRASKSDCLNHIAAIEVELREWGVIPKT